MVRSSMKLEALCPSRKLHTFTVWMSTVTTCEAAKDWRHRAISGQSWEVLSSPFAIRGLPSQSVCGQSGATYEPSVGSAWPVLRC